MADIAALHSMFKELSPDDDDGPAPSSGPAALTPADLGPAKGATSVVSGGAAAAAAAGAGAGASVDASKDPKDIWDMDDVPRADEIDDTADPRPRPKYDVLYKQDVRPEDMYLGSNDIDPSSNSCDRMVFKIELPGERVEDVDLDVTVQRIVVQSPKFRLATYLPHPVLPKEGDAKWDPKKYLLTVTLKTNRQDLLRP